MIVCPSHLICAGGMVNVPFLFAQMIYVKVMDDDDVVWPLTI